jgi:hypothetical protein
MFNLPLLFTGSLLLSLQLVAAVDTAPVARLSNIAASPDVLPGQPDYVRNPKFDALNFATQRNHPVFQCRLRIRLLLL